MIKASGDRLTIREAFDRFYDKSDLRPATLERYNSELKRWERLTDNPPIGEVGNADLLAFKQALASAGYSPATINATRRTLRAIFALLAPASHRNPAGLGILETIPYVKPAKETHGKPRRVPQEDITKVYVACKSARHPQKWVDPCDWWRALIVSAYFTGLRKSDCLSLRFDQIDLEADTIDFTANKTSKSDTFPLHPVMRKHLERIWLPQGERRERFFCEYTAANPGGLYKMLRRLCEHAGVKPFTLHDLRRTGASEVERIAPGFGSRYLQHTPTNVSERSYLNMSEKLAQAILKMRVPTGFGAGPGMQANAVRKIIAQNQKLIPTDYISSIVPPASLWGFQPGAWSFAGPEWFKLKGIYLRVLRALATAERALSVEEIAQTAWPNKALPPSWRRCTHGKISDIRTRLRKCLGLPDDFDPIPCVSRGDGGAFQIHLPFELLKDAKPREQSAGIASWEDIPHKPPASDFDFGTGRRAKDGVSTIIKYRGKRFEIFPCLRIVLKELIQSSGWVSRFQLEAALKGESKSERSNNLHQKITALRKWLRDRLNLADSFEPVPFTDSVHGGAWSITLSGVRFSKNSMEHK